MLGCAGVSIEGSVVSTREHINLSFYGRPVTAKQLLLEGKFASPVSATPLYSALDDLLVRVGAPLLKRSAFASPDLFALHLSGPMGFWQGMGVLSIQTLLFMAFLDVKKFLANLLIWSSACQRTCRLAQKLDDTVWYASCGDNAGICKFYSTHISLSLANSFGICMHGPVICTYSKWDAFLTHKELDYMLVSLAQQDESPVFSASHWKLMLMSCWNSGPAKKEWTRVDLPCQQFHRQQ